MPTEPDPVTLAQLVHRAAEITDPDGADADVTELMQPLRGRRLARQRIDTIEQRMAEAAGTLDPQEDSPGCRWRPRSRSTSRTGATSSRRTATCCG